MENLTAAVSTNATAPGKSHFTVLDGLRGVASVFVLLFHLFEPWSHEDSTKQIINHGYLAVDFFFLLSGFVIAYAYDDRWKRMSQWDFYRRRLILLQPMVIMGSVVGAAFFYFQKSAAFPMIASTPPWKVVLVMLIGCTLIPIGTSLDIRGWGEMHPLNGPAWSLFFEYCANILYAIGFRKLSNRAMSVLVVFAAAFLFQLAVFSPHGNLIGGWSITPHELHVGFARLLYPFFAGILLMRLGKRITSRNPFILSSLLLAIALCLPCFGGKTHAWENGLYEALCVILLFPLIVAIGAGEKRADGTSIRVARFFGDLSFPLYITHYPLIYIYTAWIVRDNPSIRQGFLWASVVFVVAITSAYAYLKLYDEPVRRWLSRRFLARAA